MVAALNRSRRLRVEETARHVWNNDWQMHLAGEKAFFTLGHDFVILDLADPAAMQELSRTSLRRFGHSSKRYEELMETFHLNYSCLNCQTKTTLVDGSRRTGTGIPEARKGSLPASRRYYWISVPPALGPVALVGDKAYVSRYWPRELAVLDISDPWRPVEIGLPASGNHTPNWSREENSSIPWPGGVASGPDAVGPGRHPVGPDGVPEAELAGRPLQTAPTQSLGSSRRSPLRHRGQQPRHLQDPPSTTEEVPSVLALQGIHLGRSPDSPADAVTGAGAG